MSVLQIPREVRAARPLSDLPRRRPDTRKRPRFVAAPAVGLPPRKPFRESGLRKRAAATMGCLGASMTLLPPLIGSAVHPSVTAVNVKEPLMGANTVLRLVNSLHPACELSVPPRPTNR
jgi:hypothetical protein